MSDDEHNHLLEEAELLTERRNRWFAAANKLLQTSTTVTRNNHHQFKGHLARLADIQKEYDAVQEEIIKLNVNLNENDKLNVDAPEEAFVGVLEAAQMNFRRYSFAAQPAARQVNLPKLNIPIFQGDTDSWTSFINLFNSNIHRNHSLTSPEKFSYLLSLLAGDPLSLVKSLQPLTEANYQLAYQLLQSRYNTQKRHVFHHFQALLELPQVNDNHDLPRFFTTLQQHVMSLQALGHEEATFGPMLVTVIYNKLNPYHRRRFEDSREDATTYPTLAEVLTYLQSDCALILDTPFTQTSRRKDPNKTSNALLASTSATQSPKKSDHHKSKSTPPKQKTPAEQNRSNGPSSTSSKSKPRPVQAARICPWCKTETSHSVFTCDAFLKLSMPERRKRVSEKKRCSNCLGSCTQLDKCKSSKRCQKCQQLHHSLLHEDSTPIQADSSQSYVTNSQSSACTGHSGTPANSPVVNILPTARVMVSAPKTGVNMQIRCVLDSGATDSYITTNCARKLQLRPIKTATSVTGLGQNSVRVDGVVRINLHAKDESVVFNLHPVFVVPQITGLVPSVPVCRRVRNAAAELPLADPSFDQPGQIDGLIGADLFPRVIAGECINLGQTQPRGLSTVFGIVLMGPTRAQPPKQPRSAAMTLLAYSEVSSQLERFWKLEEVPQASTLSADERHAEKHYEETTIQQENGRYMVRLPFRKDHPPLGSSRRQAEIQYHALEKRFQKNPDFHKVYDEHFLEYLENKRMSPIDPPPEGSPQYYLPHHGVFRESSTTRLRVVFNASAPTSTGISLNEVLLPGTPLQKDIREVLLHFRRHPIVFTADIKKMFLMIDVHPEDRCYQLILWRPKGTPGPVKTYQLSTVTFGVSSSPFLANRTVKQLALDHGHLYPRAAAVLRESIYVDDILAGADDEEQARDLIQDLIKLLALGGFTPRKYTSNSPSILDNFPVEDLEPPIMDDPDNPRHSVLGLDWLPKQDSFTYLIQVSPHPVTKRGVLSQISSMYDPCGFLAPVIFSAKAFMQVIWTRRIDWDDPLPEDLASSWKRFLEDLPSLRQVSIKRLLGIPGAPKQVHGFCDASDLGYSAVLYLRSAPADGTPAVTEIIIAKTRVAPLKKLNTPRLELCGAHLLANLLASYLPQLENLYSPEKIYCWSDSSNVLSWIRTPSYQLKTFVGNRVAFIQELPTEVSWHHVSTIHNPADCASRGLPPSALAENSLWKNGPPWLASPPDSWPKSLPAYVDETRLELKPANPILLARQGPILDFNHEFSSWEKAVKAIAWVRRFFSNLRRRAGTQLPKQTTLVPADQLLNDEPLRPTERLQARHCLLRLIQRQSFQAELDSLAKNKSCSVSIQRLTPFVDSQGLIRVGGRLRNAHLPADVKHPVLLPNNHPLVALLAKYYHESCLHAGPQLTQAHMSRRFWIHAGRQLIRSTVHRCIPCFRARPRNEIPIMGDLPPSRVNFNTPFTKASVDAAGPFKVKVHQLRSARVILVHLCIFVCMATKAVHIEIVHDMSTQAFLAAMDRFSARRGCPSDISSDCGTNFVGAANTLGRFTKEKDPELRRYAEKHSVKFHFNPPAAPHQGGLWESAVKSVKAHLRRNMASHVLILEEFQTLCTRIEAMLNSRPLTPLSSDPNDLQPLTPGHFLIGRPLTSPPEKIYEDKEIPRLHRWHLVSALFQHIWRRWNVEYIHLFQPRKKWIKEAENLKNNDLVLIHDPDTSPLVWKLGRIVATHPGRDDRVRVATVKTASGQLKRPVHKLFRLPLQN